MEVRSARFGHCATFFASGASAADATLVEWDQAEIAVPSGSVLDCCAVVRLERVGATEAGARSWCKRVGAKFLLVDRGTVEFEVIGFSRYRYVDSDSDDDDGDTPARERSPHGSAGRTPYRRARKVNTDGDETPPPPRRADTRRGTPFRPGGPDPNANVDSPRMSRRGTAAPMDDSESEDDDAAEPGIGTNGELQVALSSRIAPQRAAADFWARSGPVFKSGRMRETLFHDYSLAPRYDDDNDVRDEDMMHDVTPAKASRRHVRFADAKKERATPARIMKDDENMLEAVDEDSQIVEGVSSTTPCSYLPFLQLEHSITSGHEGAFADLSLALGRSFRIGFSSSSQYFKPVYAEIAPEYYTTKSFVASRETFYSPNAALPRNHFIEILRCHLSTWLTDMQHKKHIVENGHRSSPIVTDTEKTDVKRKVKVPSLKNAFADDLTTVDHLMEDLIKQIASLSMFDNNAKHGLVIFGLLGALYKFSEGSGATGDENLISRLSDWAMGPAGTLFDEQTPSQPSLRRALLLMTVGNIEEAADAAIEAGHLRLALMVSRGLEAPKDDLREDAAAQLCSYFLSDEDSISSGMEDDDGRPRTLDELFGLPLLEDFEGSKLISVDERMILLLLAGYVTPVAQYLKLSWYRVFIMELLHGVGCSELTLPERVCAAVDAIDMSGIPATAPHKQSDDIDAAYHLLKLYASPTASYPVTSGVYSSRSIGMRYEPLDSRFSWLFHQVLSAVVGCASTPRAPWHLAESFSAQLFASDMPLWAIYVMCAGSPPESLLKQTVIKYWPALSQDYTEFSVGGESTVTMLSDDAVMVDKEPETTRHGAKMGAEQFLCSILGMPKEWIHEAKAISYNCSGESMRECLEWMSTKSDEGYNHAHTILAKKIFPETFSMYKMDDLLEIRRLLSKMSDHTNITDWSTQGGLVLDYLRYIADISEMKRANSSMLRSMARRVAVMSEQADTPLLEHTAERMADEIGAAVRATLVTADGNRLAALEYVMSELEVLPANAFTKRRVGREIRVDTELSAAIANRYAAAHPIYSRFLVDVLKD